MRLRTAPARDAVTRGARLTSSLVLLLTAVAAGFTPAAADTRAELDTARGRVKALEEKITSEEARFERVQKELTSAVGRSNAAEAEVLAVRRQIKVLDIKLERTAARLADLRERVALRARRAYIYGPMHWVDLLMESESLGDFSGRLAYVGRVLEQDADAALETRRTQAEFESALTEQKRLLEQETKQLRAAEGEQRRLERLFAEQQGRMVELAATRAEALALVDSLRDKLAAEELASLGRVAGHGMPITFGEWAGDFLSEIGAPQTRDNMVVIVAWETAEYTKATWNPLATTWGMPGATVYNSHGVKNYVSKEQGLDASRKTLERPGHGYDAILSNLRAGSDAMTTGDAIRASNWCRGCANGRYVVGIIPAVQAYYERYANR